LVTNRGKALGRRVEYVLVSVALPQMEADALTSRIGRQCGFRSLQTMRDPRYVYPEDEQLGARLRQDLEGRPNTSSEFCRDHLGPLGSHLKAEVLEYPMSMPDDIRQLP
jgi:hypothetical protein